MRDIDTELIKPEGIDGGTVLIDGGTLFIGDGGSGGIVDDVE